ncbi:MAG: 2-phosphosulfolactate phosphatase [Longimicrobiales bacterium]|nr:2-phosphosulfolactate phosphatase [Longimicrobiales bacterium]
MTVDVFFSPAVVDEASVEGKMAVVIDVIRATSTLVEALANGARAIFPTISTEEAVKLASSLGREDTLLCGERKGLKVEGFDLGNSPAEFTADVVQGKQLVMTTTNGTRAFFAAEGADRVLAASFMNLSAVAKALDGVADLVIVCSGRENRFSLDDALCAGMLVQTLEKGLEEGLELNDAGRVVRDLASKYTVDADFLRSTAAGKALVKVGLEGDLDLCASLDRYSLVPEMRERRIKIPLRQGED